MFTAELHHLGTYISQTITQKYGVINEKVTDIHHCKNLYSRVDTIFPSSRTKRRLQREKKHTRFFTSAGTLIECLMLLYQIVVSIMVTTYHPKTPATFWTICISIIDTPPRFDS